jgi:hypothetical protein
MSSSGALFSDDTVCFADGFLDKVAAIHDHFDRDKDGHLNFNEIGLLQYVTSGAVMTEDQYVMVCRTLQCHPTKGLSLDMLRLTYASDGVDLDADYAKVFAAVPSGTVVEEVESSQQEELVYEAGAEGFDVS